MEGQDRVPESSECSQENVAYEYLCHLQEAKVWIESILKEKLPPITELEENLRNGVYLGRIGNVIAPDVVPLSGIYDIFQHRYRANGLQFKHTDNINYWIKALNAVDLPKIFHPETMDVYEKKNMPRVIYCIHALSKHLFKLGKTPSVQDLYGKVEFNSNEINSTCHELEKCDTDMPPFKKISGIIMNESDCDPTALHSFIVNIDQAIDNKSTGDLLQCLSDPAGELVHVLPENIEEYMTSLIDAKEEKISTLKNKSMRNNYEPDTYDEVLTQTEIQGYIRRVNCDCLWRDIQTCMKTKDKEKLKEIVPKISILELKDFKTANVECYIEVLLNLELEKVKLLTKNRSSREVMENIVHNGNRLCKERKRVSDAMLEVRRAMKSKSPTTLLKALKASPLKMTQKISEKNCTMYLKELLKVSGTLSHQNIKSAIESVNEINDANYDSNTEIILETSPMEELSIKCTAEQCEKNDESADMSFDRNDDLEKCITLLQACIRGFLIRIEIRKKKAVTCHRTPSPTLKDPEKWEIKTFLDSKSDVTDGTAPRDYSKHIDKIIKIQAFWRGYSVRKSLKCLSPSGNYPEFIILRRMALMYPVNGHDYSEQFKLQTLRSSVVETIKKNQELANKLDEIDTKIGLLVHNRMLIQSPEAVDKKSVNGVSNKFQQNGIKTLNKEAKTILDGYRHLFYILQTDPAYLTRLITRLPQKSTHVLQSCVLSLFNYGSSTRDAYLLLRLFRSALVEEVKCKFQKPIDAIKGNPLVLRLALGFSRQCEGYNPLRNILGFLIENVLNEKTFIDTNPVDIYRRWINKTETETGKLTQLAPTVTREEALSYPEVSQQLKHNLKILKMWVKTFLKRITACSHKFPYPLRFVAKILWKALREKFPDASEKDIVKIVGNLVFYQYINSAIVAPDTFYIISLPPDQHLKPEQRKNLASIAKILQFAAWKKGFGVESQHLMCLNPFIISCHEEMKFFCKKCCSVEDLEEHFNITKYTEAALIEKPKIYITLEEICECHKILYEERHHISSDPFDPIQEILDSLGNPPSVADLTGCTHEEAMSSRTGKTQLCLELDNKYQLPHEDPTEAEKLFIKTKELIIKRLPELKGRSLKASVEKEHPDIASNLLQLELSGMVRSADDYSSIIRSIISDVTQKQLYRQNTAKEIGMLSTALERLNEKKKYYEVQLSYYEQYLTMCLNSLTKSSNKVGENKLRRARYSANQLLEKGVLVSLDGVPVSQLKNVQFEIAATEVNGMYSVRGRFMGVEVDKVNLDVQDLLQHQFEGQPVMDLFGKAKINVNLLLHLLNKKFHVRT